MNPFASDGFSPSDECPGRAPWDAQGTSANAKDLRGKILRVHPEPDGSITIPTGNLFPPGTPKTRPEIYVMGCRNPFRIGLLYWGEVGPDAQAAKAERGLAGFDEINRARAAGNFGWPHFVADNKPDRRYDFAKKTSGELLDAAHPINSSPNNTGPRKLPAAYDHTLFVCDWMRSWILAVKLDSQQHITSMKRFLPATEFKRPTDMELGSEGALYVLEWGTQYNGGNADARIVRIDYSEAAEGQTHAAR